MRFPTLFPRPLTHASAQFKLEQAQNEVANATGPKAYKRPADIIGNAARIMRIATGEEADDVVDDGEDPAAKAERSARRI